MPTVEQLERLLETDPTDSFVLYGLAQAHAQGGHHDDAISFYDRCLSEDPQYCYAYYHKARSLEALGRVDEATETLRSGRAVSQEVGDAKAVAEIDAYLDELGGSLP